jgi:hypothetical protein
MRPTGDVRRPLRGWWPAAVLGAVLLGIAAMHGLAPHGAFGHEAGHEPVVRVAAVHADVAPPTHGAHASGSAVWQSATVAGLDAGLPGEGSVGQSTPVGTGALQACVVVLLVVGAVLLARSRRSTRPALLVPRPPSRASMASYRLRDPDPPSLAQLAVLRC